MSLKSFLTMVLMVALGQNLGAAEAGYRLVPEFARLPEGQEFGAVAGVATDSRGQLFVFRRAAHPVLVFDRTGRFVRSFGDEWFKSPHGLRIDRQDNVWVTDNANHTVIKFNPGGKVLLKLGERDVPGVDESHFNRPADIEFAPNGDFFVADGYGNSRVVKFDQDGKFLKAWGKKGKGEGEFNLPHAVRMDSKGQLYVGDRENNRIQVFDQQGRFIRQFGGFAPFGLFITKDDILFVADGRANKVLKMTLTGQVLTLWGATGSEPGNFNMPHGLTVDTDGAVYVGETVGKRLQKFIRN